MNEYDPSSFSRISEAFNEGGWWMYPITFLGCLLPALALVFLLVGFLSKTNRALPLSITLLVLSVLPPALGVLGAQVARSQAERAIASADPAEQEVIRMASESELLHLEVFGLGAAMMPSFFGFVLLGLGLGRLDRFLPRPA